jgi:hypothetical protein
MSNDKGYNGWSNYETWAVKLWIDNEEGSYRYWQEAAQAAWEDRDRPSRPSYLTEEENAVADLGARLEEEIKESAPNLGASMFADLLSAAISEVDWQEIAAAMIEDVDKSDDSTEDD